jgi:hypothetical protein
MKGVARPTPPQTLARDCATEASASPHGPTGDLAPAAHQQTHWVCARARSGFRMCRVPQEDPLTGHRSRSPTGCGRPETLPAGCRSGRAASVIGVRQRAIAYLNWGLGQVRGRVVVEPRRCGRSDRSAGALAYLAARPWGRRRNGRWVDPRGATPAARSLVDRRPGAGVATVAGAGRKTGCHLGVVGCGTGSRDGQATGCRASGPRLRSVWKQRRASFLAIVTDARVCESPRALSAR